ncbi:cisplatin damage response ATP-dependent DNA ligase [Taklimakanibacter lacteus]|uniref:cisplatin damage response ATP-dependent DNA ligase n=1 Tax=Taklimakanibacter lacteus TaxID=2268456 RepID=UPI000E662D1D
MQSFAELLDRLVYTTARNAKLKLLEDYFRATPDPDRGWALSALTDGLPLRLPIRKTLATILAPHVDPLLYRLSRDYVGDTAETVSLLWPDARLNEPPPRISDVVAEVSAASSREFPRVLESLLGRLDVKGRFALLKLLSGALRVGVSARLAKTAIAQTFGREVEEIEEVWHAVSAPYADMFAWLEGRGVRPDPGRKATFRPVMLAHPIEDGDWQSFAPQDVAAEWKWDGIRVQLSARPGDVRLFSRAGDDVSTAFPDIVQAFAHTQGVLDGELLVLRQGVVASFNDLQQRLNRKTVTGRMLQDYPAHIRLYDILFDGNEDVRTLSFIERRQHLEAWYERFRPSLADVSALVPFAAFAELESKWQLARENGIEGLMLKRKASPYLAGRPKGHWYKWKRAALTIDCVLMYAQRGSGKRSSYYSDYTFGVWKTPDELVPVGKAYSGFTDEELLRLDRWIRTNTVERFGPVRQVKPGLVLEIAFDAVQTSSRHKSGLALRFPRVHRIRWDKPVQEAETLDAVKALVPS